MDREPDADHTLVELLYGELDGAARDRAEARVAADPALSSELDGMRALRGTLRTWGEASDAEPPGDLSGLLAAARASARPVAVAAEPSTPGLWERLSRWMAPLLAHPGLAAAATLVLVAGVAGTLYVTGGQQMAEPTAAPAATMDQAPSELAIAPEPVPPREAPAAAAAATISEESAAPRGATSGAIADKRERAESKASAAEKPKERRRAMAAPKDDADAEGGVAGGAGGEAFESEAALPARDEGPAPTQAPAAVPPPPAKAPAPTPRPSSTAADTAEPAAPGRDDLARLTREAREAAARADCARVRALSERVRGLDAAYHQRNFRGDKAIAACLAAKKL